MDELNTYERELAMYAKKVQRVLKPAIQQPEQREDDSSNQLESSIRMILPKRQLPKFTGDVRECLAIIASFKDIHDDKNLSDSTLQQVPLLDPIHGGWVICQETSPGVFRFLQTIMRLHLRHFKIDSADRTHQ